MTGASPLGDLRVVEFAGLVPGPFAAMLLADAGQTCSASTGPAGATAARSPAARPPPGLDLKGGGPGRRGARRAAPTSCIEGFRPGVMERLGLGPDACLAVNPRLVYGRMTGWGQDRPARPRAGHDINYLAVTGALGPIGRRGGRAGAAAEPLGDYGGGAMLLVFGILTALVERSARGRGQVVDAAMVDGVACS